MVCSKAVNISLLSLNQISRNCFFTFGNKKDLNMLHFHIVRHDFTAKIHCSSKPDVPLHYRREKSFSLFEETCHKHALTYQLSFTLPSLSNGTDWINSDLMKNKLPLFFFRYFCFNVLCLDTWSVVDRQTFYCSFSWELSKIHQQLLCQIHDETDLLYWIEVGVVFDDRLMSAAQTFLRFK